MFDCFVMYEYIYYPIEFVLNACFENLATSLGMCAIYLDGEC